MSIHDKNTKQTRNRKEIPNSDKTPTITTITANWEQRMDIHPINTI